MNGQAYWYIASGEEDAFGRSHNVLSIPWWTEAVKWHHQEGNERVETPMFFSTREAEEAELRALEATQADDYPELIERFGEETVNEARHADLLEDSDFLTVMVDDHMMLRTDFKDRLTAELG